MGDEKLRAERRRRSVVKRVGRQKTAKTSMGFKNGPDAPYLVDNHLGCGCPLCKPWKHGLDEPLKPAERRRATKPRGESE